MENEQRCFSKVILESNVTANKSIKVIRVLQHSPPIINGVTGDALCRDLETIIVLVTLVCNSIPQKSHHSLTLSRSRFRDSATVNLTPGMAQSLFSSVIGSMKKSSEVHRRNNHWCPLQSCHNGNSLLRQPFTITYCDRFD